MDLALQNTEAYFRAAAAILAMRPGSSEPDMSAALLKRHYGLTGSIATLSSEVERTVELPVWSTSSGLIGGSPTG